MSISKIEERGIIAWFIDNHVAANILMFLFIIGGIISISSMRSETFPTVDPRLITVSVVYPGATPYEVADAVTNRVEESLLGIEGVKRIASTASEGTGVINVELKDFADADTVYNDVETNVNSLVDFPPEDAERPIISKVKVTPNVVTLALYGDASEATIKYWAETIEDDLRTLPGVALTAVSGIRDYEISVEVSEQSLRKYGLSLEDVRRAVSNFSVDTPAGTVESSQGEISIRVQERGYNGEDFEKMAIRALPDGSILRLKDIGRVVDGFEDTNLISKFNGQRAAFIEVRRSESEDTLEVASIVKDYLDKVELPTGLKLALQNDQTAVLNDRINLMLRNAVLGFMLVFLVLLLFLDLKLAFWVSVAVPVSFLGGLMVVYFMGYSINMISLFALIIVLGIVVDDAIVMGESIFEEQENAKGDHNAVFHGVKKVIAPVTVGVTTTMAAFAPLAFSTGTLGQVISNIPVVVIPILFFSLIEAYFVLPSHLSNPSRWSKGIVLDIRRIFDRFLKLFVDRVLSPAAAFFISWRYATVAGFFAFAIVTFSMVSSGTVKFIFFPSVEGDEITIDVTMPVGTPFKATEKTLLNIEEEVINVRKELGTNSEDPFQSIVVTIGQTSASSNPGSVGGASFDNSIGQVKIQLLPSDFRELSAKQIEGKIRKRIEHLSGIEQLNFASSPIGSEPDIEIELTHPDENILNQAAKKLKAELSNLQGTLDVTDSFEMGNVEYVFSLSDEGLAVGLSPAELGQQLRAAFFGLEVQRFQRGRSEIIVFVRYPKDERESLAALNDMRIRLPDGSETPLSSVANIKEQTGFSQIQTVNGRRVVSVTSDVDYSIATPNEIFAALNANILPQLKQRFTGLTYTFEGESREQSEDLASLGSNMLIAVIVIFVLLGGQLRSYIQPIIIMVTIPFGVVGAIWGHFLLGENLTFISMFGIVALSGVVVNDSVVLIDYLNQHRNNGKSLFDSCLIAIRRRFRPILLTTLTTSLGLLPMLLETSMQARFLIPMVISLAMGILFVTVIVLVLTPVLIMITDDIRRFFRQLGLVAGEQHSNNDSIEHKVLTNVVRDA